MHLSLLYHCFIIALSLAVSLLCEWQDSEFKEYMMSELVVASEELALRERVAQTHQSAQRPTLDHQRPRADRRHSSGQRAHA